MTDAERSSANVASLDPLLERSAMLLGDRAMAQLQNATVCICGLGGVGSYVAEALARGGVGRLTLVDFDLVASSNINRQLCALTNTIGCSKVQVIADRIGQINPNCRVTARKSFLHAENADEILSKHQYLVDAIDDVPGKVAIIRFGKENRIPVISAMGAAKRLHPELLRLADIADTFCCPLARIMRRELKKHGISNGVPVVFSQEQPVEEKQASPKPEQLRAKQPLGSVSFVPGAMGLIIAGKVIRDLCGIED